MDQVQYIDGNPKYLPESVSSGTQATKLKDAVLPKELSNTQNLFIFKLLSHILPAFQSPPPVLCLQSPTCILSSGTYNPCINPENSNILYHKCSRQSGIDP